MLHRSLRIPYFHGLNRAGNATKPGVEPNRNMKSTILKACVLGIVFSIATMGAQTVRGQVFSESFDSGNFLCDDAGTLASAFASPNGTWTITSLPGDNGFVAPNTWYISKTTVGNTFAGLCTESCFDVAMPTPSLHVGTANGAPPGTDVGAFFYTNPLSFYNTDKRVESPTIDCSGSFSLTMTFNYTYSAVASGQCFVSYFDGTSWTDLQELTVLGSGVCDPAEQVWGSTTINLPTSANDNPNVKIGFRWINDIATEDVYASVAIDEIVVESGEDPDLPQAQFSIVGDTEICEESCISLMNETIYDSEFSTGATGATFAWTFEGGTPATSSFQNPVVCYSDPGTYNITLVVTDNIGESAPFTITDAVTVLDCGPNIQISVNNPTPCLNEDCVDFSSEASTGNNIDPDSWVWVFTSESGAQIQSNQANPADVCLNELGFWDVSVSATDDDLTETVEYEDFIEVLDCSGPDIDFSVSSTVICVGDCIELTDLSTTNSAITSWHWSLPGGQAEGEALPDTSTQQNPTVCYDMAGDYEITLSAVDSEGPSAITKTITITVDPCTGPPQADFGVSDTLICAGDCVDFYDQSLGNVTSYLWIFNGINQVSEEENPTVICYDTPGTYTVSLTASNDVDVPDQETKVAFITVEQCLNPPVPRIDVAQDTLCAGKCVDFINMSTGLGSEFFEYQWNFQGAVEGSQTSTEVNPTGICYDTPGSYSVSLTATRPNGADSTRVFENVVTVVSTPECRPTIEVQAPDTICAGDCAFFTANFTDADSVRWTFPGANPATSTALEPGLVCFPAVDTATIIVEAWNASGAAQPQFLTLFVGERPPLNAGPDVTINSGATVTLTAGLGGQSPRGEFLWQPFDMVDNFRAQSVQTSPTETTQYIVYYQEPGTCTAIDTVTVFVNFVQAVGVPTAFSPNGDGVNDRLRVLGQGIARMEFKIFNRYGQLVFETKDQSVGWDGTYKGEELNPGTFVYTLEVVFAEGEREVYTGDFTLVR